jgi:hypothetical protein
MTLMLHAFRIMNRAMEQTISIVMLPTKLQKLRTLSSANWGLVPVLLQGSGELRSTPAAAVTFNMTVLKVNGLRLNISLCEPLLQADLHLKLICMRYLWSSFVCTPLSTTRLALGHSIVRLDIMYAGALLCFELWNVWSSSSLVRSASYADKYTGRALICCWHTRSHYTIAVTARRRLALAQLELAFLKSNYLAASASALLHGSVIGVLPHVL